MANYLDKYGILPTVRESYQCNIGKCEECYKSARELLSHFCKKHRQDIDFKSTCLHSEKCFHTSNFTSFDGVYKHLKKYHPSFFVVTARYGEQITRIQTQCEESVLDGDPQPGILSFLLLLYMIS